MRKIPRLGVAVAVTAALATAAGAFAAPPAASPAASPAGRPAAVRRPLPPAAVMSPVQPGGPATLGGAAGSTRARLSISRNKTLDINNWAGYAAYRRGRKFRFIQASFFVPYLDCSAAPSAGPAPYSSHWVGLDGLRSNTVEQVGVAAWCKGMSAQYYAWYEMYPKVAHTARFKISPGDAITARAYFNVRTLKYQLSLADRTNGHHFSEILGCADSCHITSAEAISEAPSSVVNGHEVQHPLADFSAEAFTRIHVTDLSGQRATMVSPWWGHYRIIQQDAAGGGSGGAVLDRPTSLLDGAAFVNYWAQSQ